MVKVKVEFSWKYPLIETNFKDRSGRLIGMGLDKVSKVLKYEMCRVMWWEAHVPTIHSSSPITLLAKLDKTTLEEVDIPIKFTIKELVSWDDFPFNVFITSWQK